MPLLYYTRQSVDTHNSYFYAEIPQGKAQIDVIPRATVQDTGQTSSSSSLATAISNYENLADYLKSCFEYIFIAINGNHHVEKRDFVRLLMAQGLIPEKSGEVMDDTAADIIKELINLGMLKESGIYASNLRVNKLYRGLCLLRVDREKDFIDKAVNSPIHLVIEDDGKHLPSNFKSLLIRSFFAAAWVVVSSHACRLEAFSKGYLETVFGLKFLSVLVLDSSIDYLPDEIGNLVHLQYLGCALGNLRKLQTLHIYSPTLSEFPIEILNNKQLRHLYILDKIRVAKGFAT